MPGISALTGAARGVVGLLNSILPKLDKAVLAGFPDREDSIQELARQLSSRRDLQTIVLVEEPGGPETWGEGVVECRKRSLAGFWHYLTARYVFFTHGLYLSPPPPRPQVCVNVWHGMPLKRIGHLIGRVPPHSSRVIATSDFFRPFVAAAFAKPEDEVLVTGIPRNDVMVRAASRSAEIKRMMGLGDGHDQARLLFWLPTFRQGVRGIIRTDGVSHESIFGMDDMDVSAFEALLEKHNCVCIAKPHPMAAEYSDRFESSRIRIWRDSDLTRHGLSLYEIVGAADVLVTDASSVYVDYLLLDRPVIIAFPDLEEYKATRGFSLHPVEDYLGGPIARSFGELQDAIEDCLLRDSRALDRRRIAALFHDATDDQSTARLIDAVLSSKFAQACNTQNSRRQQESAVVGHCSGG